MMAEWAQRHRFFPTGVVSGGEKWVFSPAILQSPSLRFLPHWNFFLGLRDASMHVLWWCATLIFCFFQPLIDQLLAHLIMKRSKNHKVVYTGVPVHVDCTEVVRVTQCDL